MGGKYSIVPRNKNLIRTFHKLSLISINTGGLEFSFLVLLTQDGKDDGWACGSILLDTDAGRGLNLGFALVLCLTGDPATIYLEFTVVGGAGAGAGFNICGVLVREPVPLCQGSSCQHLLSSWFEHGYATKRVALTSHESFHHCTIMIACSSVELVSILIAIYDSQNCRNYPNTSDARLGE